MAVLVAPGNGGNRAGRVGLARELSERGLAVLLMDYRGYGGNPGSPSEEGLAADAVAAPRHWRGSGSPPERTIYFGESLGTGVVAALQARHPPAGMVLRSPFTELADVGAHHYPFLPVRLLLRDRFPVVEHLSSSQVPLTVIYADHDSIVPSALSERVADAAPSLIERVVINGADHNDPVMFGPKVAEAVSRLARDRVVIRQTTARPTLATRVAPMAASTSRSTDPRDERRRGDRRPPQCGTAYGRCSRRKGPATQREPRRRRPPRCVPTTVDVCCAQRYSGRGPYSSLRNVRW